MTIGNPSSGNRVQINGNGVTSSASIDWSFWDHTDLKVIHTAADGTDTVWSYGISPGSWAFAGGNGSTGTVTFTAADLAAGERLTVIPAEKLDQPVDLNSGNISQSAMEEAADKLAARVQREAERVDRAVKLKESTTHTSGIVIELPTEGAVMIGGSGGSLVNGPTADEITNAQQYASDASDAKDAAESAQAASESARDGAVSAQSASETAQGLAEAAAATAASAASQLGIAQFGTKSDLEVATVLASQKSAEISGYTTAGDGGGDLYKRVDAEPSHAGKIRSADQYLSDGTEDVTNGGWWEKVRALNSDEIFGYGGVRVVVGKDLDAHYGWGGWASVGEGKRIYVYRRGGGHATDNSAAVWAAESFDGGATLVNHRVIVSATGTNDHRVQRPRMLANGRFGFLVNRFDEAGTDFDPLFVYTDDPTADTPTFSSKALVRPGGSSSYSFDAHGGIIDFPASQGGDDDEGFIAFGFISAGGYGYLSTTDNFENYAWQTTTVAEPEGDVVSLSEVIQIPIGSDRWICYARNTDSGGWADEAACWVTEDLTDWGSIVSSGISLGGNPPSGFYDEDTNKVHLFFPSRGGRYVDGNNYDNWLMHVEADADELWTANGDFSALASGAVDLEPFMPMPYWGTFYADFKRDETDYWCGTFTCAEDGEAGTPGATALIAQIGDFVPTGIDKTIWNFLFSRRIFGRSAKLRAMTNDADDYTLELINRSDTGYLQLGSYGLSTNANYLFDLTQGATFKIGSGKKFSVTNSSDIEKASIDDAGNLSIEGSLETTSLSLRGFLGAGATDSALAISSGEITVTRTHHLIDTEASAASDDLDVINGGEIGDILVLGTSTSSRDVTVKNSASIECGSDRVLSDVSKRITLIKRSSTVWTMLAFADN